ncbi:MAG: hypothetical protein AAGL24_28335 [Pseudomonadota bacterium]
MGTNICFLGARLAAEEMAKILGLELSAPLPEVPERGSWIGEVKSSGWTVFWSEDGDFGVAKQTRVEDLSTRTEVIHCQLVDTCMASFTESWIDGSMVWMVYHSGEEGDVFNLEIEGQPPEKLEPIKKHYFSKQEAEGDLVDYVFQVPIDLAYAILGFEYDGFNEPPEVKTCFQVLNL